MESVPIIAAASGLVGALLAFLGVRWRFSGSIDSTEAATLWAQSESIRDWAMGRIESLEGQLAASLEREAVLRERVAKLEAHAETQRALDDPPAHLG